MKYVYEWSEEKPRLWRARRGCIDLAVSAAHPGDYEWSVSIDGPPLEDKEPSPIMLCIARGHDSRWTLAETQRHAQEIAAKMAQFVRDSADSLSRLEEEV